MSTVLLAMELQIRRTIDDCAIVPGLSPAGKKAHEQALGHLQAAADCLRPVAQPDGVAVRELTAALTAPREQYEQVRTTTTETRKRGVR